MEDLINKKDRISQEIIRVNVKLSNKKLSWKERRQLKKESNKLIKELANVVCQLNGY